MDKELKEFSELVKPPEAYEEGFEDMQRRVPDVRKLERAIGMKPSTSLEQIIADVVADQRRLLESSCTVRSPTTCSSERTVPRAEIGRAHV